MSDPVKPLFDCPIGDRIRQAHAEHVAAVDPWEGADSIETKVWRSPLHGGVENYVAPSGDIGDSQLASWWGMVAGAVVILGDGTG
jgi:hypothetical protein